MYFISNDKFKMTRVIISDFYIFTNIWMFWIFLKIWNRLFDQIQNLKWNLDAVILIYNSKFLLIKGNKTDMHIFYIKNIVFLILGWENFERDKKDTVVRHILFR